MLRTLQPAAVAAALAAAGGRRAAAGRGGAAPAPYSTSAGALDWLRKFTNYEQSGVPQAAGTNTDAGFDLVRGRNQRRPVACRAPPHSVAECPYGCCVTSWVQPHRPTLPHAIVGCRCRLACGACWQTWATRTTPGPRRPMWRAPRARAPPWRCWAASWRRRGTRQGRTQGGVGLLRGHLRRPGVAPSWCGDCACSRRLRTWLALQQLPDCCCCCCSPCQPQSARASPLLAPCLQPPHPGLERAHSGGRPPHLGRRSGGPAGEARRRGGGGSPAGGRRPQRL